MSSQLADKALLDLERVRSALLGEAKRLVARLDTQRGSAVLATDREAAQTVVAVARDLDRLLRELGVRSVQELVDSTAVQALTSVMGPTEIPASARRELQAIVDGQTAEVAKSFGAAASDIRQLLAVATTTSAQVSIVDLEARIAATMETTLARVRPAVDAAVMGAGRLATVVATQAAADEEGVDFVYLYSGPLDATTRPFCAQHLGKAYTLQALQRLDNGQLSPVQTFAGGYNCRHLLSPITVGTARRRNIEVVE